ncbi:MAG: methylmalonyl-CoA mutase [Deltaproteobacteria bacterium]|nr:methylmalonyl-CoA mutase [Deltaproteobacteria bacterium]
MAEKKPGKKRTPREATLESGIPLKTVYGPEDSAGGGEVGEPGAFPFVRGIHPAMYRTHMFTMRQYAGFGTPRETNERFKLLIGQGQSALNVAFDLPTQNGLDSDDTRAEGEVGRVGMAVDTLADFETAFDGIDLGRVSTALTINAVAGIMIAMHQAAAEKQGVAPGKIRGTTQNDILKEYVGRGAWIFPVEPSMHLIGDTIIYCAEHLPLYSPVSVCGYHIRESGADPAQEMAYALLIAEAYARHVMDRGLDIDAFAPRLSFNFDIHGGLFEQVAKFRAGRRAYARMMRDELGARNPKSMVIRMIAGGGGGGLTIEQPENNIIRSTIYAMASALAGTQTMALCCYDEAYTIPSEKASLMGLRTMQIVAEESGVTDVVDPLGGSWYVEWLTDAMEAKIREHMESIRAYGGIVKAVSEGHVQRQVALQAYREEQAIRDGTIPKVGVNRYRMEEERRDVELHPHDPRSVEEQLGRLGEVRAQRNDEAVRGGLEKLKQEAQEGRNLMPTFLECVRAYATVGEMVSVLKRVFGEFEDPRI